jgi:hypothetical protein
VSLMGPTQTPSDLLDRWASPVRRRRNGERRSVQRALGHASATTTLSTYSHLWPTAEDRTRHAAQQLFADSCGLVWAEGPPQAADLGFCPSLHVEAELHDVAVLHVTRLRSSPCNYTTPWWTRPCP